MFDHNVVWTPLRLFSHILFILHLQFSTGGLAPGISQQMDEAGLTRSMSKKGCSPDNSACEGFFGRMKNEMFYGEKWDKISVEEFISIINQYMQWYRDKRIKLSLGGLSPMEYRRSLGIA